MNYISTFHYDMSYTNTFYLSPSQRSSNVFRYDMSHKIIYDIGIIFIHSIIKTLD